MVEISLDGSFVAELKMDSDGRLERIRRRDGEMTRLKCFPTFSLCCPIRLNSKPDLVYLTTTFPDSSQPGLPTPG